MTVRMVVCFCRTDGGVFLSWNTVAMIISSGVFSLEHGVPTSVDFNGCDPAHMLASFCSGDVVLYDLETSQNALVLKCQGDSSKTDTRHLSCVRLWK